MLPRFPISYLSRSPSGFPGDVHHVAVSKALSLALDLLASPMPLYIVTAFVDITKVITVHQVAWRLLARYSTIFPVVVGVGKAKYHVVFLVS